MSASKPRYQLRDGRTDALLVPDLILADRFFNRFWGLMGRAGLEPNQAILLRPCASVHTCFMRFSLDLVFLSRAGEVLAIHNDVAPWRFRIGPRGTHSILESSCQAFQWSIGQQTRLAIVE